MGEIIKIGKDRKRKTTRCIASCGKRLVSGIICNACERRFLPHENSAIAVCKNCDEVYILHNNLTEAHPNVYAMEYVGLYPERHIYEIDDCRKCDPRFEKRTVTFKRLVPEEK